MISLEILNGQPASCLAVPVMVKNDFRRLPDESFALEVAIGVMATYESKTEPCLENAQAFRHAQTLKFLAGEPSSGLDQ